ncbi:MAG TPA: type IV pilus modification protein PilV [Betaproteobacteria bacterium]|nr:type IV pilus modification protein PilV [Betaproteobacteria bacterium]
MHQKGFTLLEVLVAIVVLSIGLLGLAGLMASSVRNNHSAYQRTQAAWLAYDMVDRMRANRAYAVTLATDYNVALGSASASANLAGTDVTDWKTALSTTLPAGDGSVVVNGTTGAATVIVQWNDARGTGGNSAQQVRVDSQL